MTRFDLHLLGNLRLAALGGIRTAGVEFASGRRIGRRGNASFQNDPVHLTVRIRNRDGRKQCFRIGMHRMVEDLPFGTILHQTSQV